MPPTFQNKTPTREVFDALAQRRTLPPCGGGLGCDGGRPSAMPFTRAYLINVDLAGERFALMSAQLNSTGLPWEVWPGVVPRNETYASLAHLLPKSFRTAPELFFATVADPRLRNMVGSYLSHITLWGHLARLPRSSPDDGYLILEDDLWLQASCLGRIGVFFRVQDFSIGAKSAAERAEPRRMQTQEKNRFVMNSQHSRYTS